MSLRERLNHSSEAEVTELTRFRSRLDHLEQGADTEIAESTTAFESETKGKSWREQRLDRQLVGAIFVLFFNHLP
jgi:hypothetical protein